MAVIDRYLQDYVLEPWQDTVEPPTVLPSTPGRQSGTLIISQQTYRAKPPSYFGPAGVQTSIGGAEGISPEPSYLLGLPVEVLNKILEEAALSAMVEDERLVGSVTIDCLRPEAGVQQTMDCLGKLVQRFCKSCKSMALVCRAFHSLIIPLLWREPFFSPQAQNYDAFLALLPQTTAIAPTAATLLPPKPFWTYVKTFTTFGSSLFHRQPQLLLPTLPLLQNLETLRFGSASADMPLKILEELVLVAPRSIRRLPDVLLHPKEKSEDASQRLSAVITLASRCERLETFDIIWGQALGGQLEHLLFALQLQSLQPEGIRPIALRSLSFNEQCEVTVSFLEQLPRVAPGITSLHFEIGSRLVAARKDRGKAFDVVKFVEKLPYLESFSFTPSCEVPKVGTFNNLLVTHPNMKCLQLNITDFDPRRFLIPLLAPATAKSLRCLCIATSADDLSTLLVLRRPWRIQQIAPEVLTYIDLLGLPSDEQMQLDLFRKAELMTLPRKGVNYD